MALTAKLQVYDTVLENSWDMGEFFSIHGYGVGHSHTRATFMEKVEGHVDTATMADPTGPGVTKNKR